MKRPGDSSARHTGRRTVPGVKEYLTLDQAARDLGRSRADTYQLVRSGELFGIRVSSSDWRVTRRNLDAYHDGQPQSSAP